MKIDIIAGARPNFMKIAPIISALQSAPVLTYRLVHTGQHYDAVMSESFFSQLGIPKPDVNFEVGSGSQAEQTALIMKRYENLLEEEPTDLCLVVGDVNSTMACSIVAKKHGCLVAHVEGGLRSRDWAMPEEINRLVTDSISDFFFTTSIYANENLKNEGVSSDRIFFVGNTMIDTLIANTERFRVPEIWADFGLSNGNYLLLTLHRPSNVDDIQGLQKLLSTICRSCQDLKVVFPAHPRTAHVISQGVQLPKNCLMTQPSPYLEFCHLLTNSRGIVTDSGGVTEEATYLNVPCITLRENTERPETVISGTNVLVGNDESKIESAMKDLVSNNWKSGAVPEKWDGYAAARLVEGLMRINEQSSLS